MTTEAEPVSQELPQLLTGLLPKACCSKVWVHSLPFRFPSPYVECFRTEAVSCQPVSVRRYVEGKLPRVTIGAKDIVSGELGRSVTKWDLAQCPEELTTDEVYPSLSAR